MGGGNFNFNINFELSESFYFSIVFGFKFNIAGVLNPSIDIKTFIGF